MFVSNCEERRFADCDRVLCSSDLRNRLVIATRASGYTTPQAPWGLAAVRRIDRQSILIIGRCALGIISESCRNQGSDPNH